MSKKDWFKLKRYPHIGLPLFFKDRSWITKFVTDTNKVSKHAFLPFIHKEIVTRKFRRVVLGNRRSRLRIPDKKVRHIFYSGHLDSMVYSYYASLLQEEYEKRLTKLKLSDCVTAYRTVELTRPNGKTRNKNNIDFADEVFNCIRAHPSDAICVVTFDIKSFFDTLDHKILKREWRRVIGSGNSLPKDHFNLFRNITQFSFVDERRLFNLFKESILTETNNGDIRHSVLRKRKYLKKNGAIAFCENRDIELVRKKNLIVANKKLEGKTRQKGIPQGSPISSVLANIYMMGFDARAKAFADSIGGTYRRYSDDMIVICDARDQEEVIEVFKKEICEVNLNIQDAKTQRFLFRRERNGISCYLQQDGKLLSNKMLEYLGFAFNGVSAYLKNSSLAGFYRKMKRGVRKEKGRAKRTRGNKIHKSYLYKRFTYKGQDRRRIFKRQPGTSNVWVESNRYDWGNYLSYANMAANLMAGNRIKGQIRRHWQIFHEHL
jgi:hypothetical protein